MTRRGAVEVGFVLLGFYTFLLAISMAPLMFYGGGAWSRGWFLDSLKSAFPILLLAAAGCALIVWRRRLSAWFFPEETKGDGASPSTEWQAPAYSFGFAMLGIFTLIHWMPRAFVTLMMLLDSLRATSSRVFPASPFERMTPSHWRNLFSSGATLAIAVYLLLGAPGLKEWLVKRTRTKDATASPGLKTDED
jgi:hypothetical protein